MVLYSVETSNPIPNQTTSERTATNFCWMGYQNGRNLFPRRNQSNFLPVSSESRACKILQSATLFSSVVDYPCATKTDIVKHPKL